MAKTILIVDDNAYIRPALCGLFKRESDFEVCGEAENGKEAIAKALELHPNLIVLDLSMPVMNGLDAARELKRLMPTVPFPNHSPHLFWSAKPAVCFIKTPRSHFFPQSGKPGSLFLRVR